MVPTECAGDGGGEGGVEYLDVRRSGRVGSALWEASEGLFRRVPASLPDPGSGVESALSPSPGPVPGPGTPGPPVRLTSEEHEEGPLAGSGRRVTSKDGGEAWEGDGGR